MSSQERSDTKNNPRPGSQPRAMPVYGNPGRGMSNDHASGHGAPVIGDPRQNLRSPKSPPQFSFGTIHVDHGPQTHYPAAHSPNKQGNGRPNDLARRSQEAGRGGGGRATQGRHSDAGRGRGRPPHNNFQHPQSQHLQFGTADFNPALMGGPPQIPAGYQQMPPFFLMPQMQYQQVPQQYFNGQHGLPYNQPRGPPPASRVQQENKPKPAPKTPEAQKKRTLTIINPNTNKPVDLASKPASPSSSQEIPTESKPTQGGPSRQTVPEPPKRHVLSITTPPAGTPTKAAGKASPVVPSASSATSSDAADKVVSDKTLSDSTAADKAALDKAAADKAAADKAASDKAAADKAAADKAAADKAAADKAVADKAAADKAVADKAAADKAAADKAAADKAAAETAASKKAAEDAAKKAAELKQKATQEAESKAEKAVEEAAAGQREAAAATASDDVTGDNNKTFAPKKKGKKALNDKIAEKEAAEKEASKANSKASELEAYTAPQARRPEPEAPVSAATRSSDPIAEAAVSSPLEDPDQQSEEAETWETSVTPLVEAKPAQGASPGSYSRDFLLMIEKDLKQGRAIESWLSINNIEIKDLLRFTPRVPAAHARMGGDKWAQKGPLPGPASGIAPGLAGPPPGRPHGAMGSRGDLPINGGGGDSWRRREALPPAPPPQRLPALHKATNRFERGKLISENPEEEARQKAIKSLLNKVTPEKYAVILEKLLKVDIPSVLSLSGLIDQIYEKGVTEPTFTELYARLCYDLNQKLGSYPPEPGSGEEKEITFRRLLLNKCQEEFTEGTRAIAAVKAREQTDAAKQETQLEEGEIKNEAEDALEARRKEAAEAVADQKARYRALGNMQFVGFLYMHRLIAEKIMHECITALLDDVENPRREDIECLCKLITTIGKQLDVGKLKDRMHIYFNMRMKKIYELPHLEPRLRFMIQDVFDLRRNQWQERRKVEGPKTIDEIHRDARNEQMAAQRADYASRRNGPPMGGRGGYRDSQPVRPPPQSLTRRHDDRLDAPPRPMQRIPSQEAFAPGGRVGGFRPGGMLSSRNASPATREQTPATGAATTAAPSAAGGEAQPSVEPPQAAGQAAEDAEIKGWDEFLAKYSAGQDTAWAKSVVGTVLLPRYEDHALIFSEIFTAAVEKRDVKQGPTEEILHHLIEANLIAPAKMLTGLSSMLEALGDVDAPFAPNLVGHFGGTLVSYKKTSMKELCGVILEVGGKAPEDEFAETLIESGSLIKVLAAVLTEVASKSSKEAAKSSWEETGLDVSDFLSEMDRGRERAALLERYKLGGIL